MLIEVTAVNGETETVTIGINYIILIERYKSPGEINAIITLPNRVLYVAETYGEVIALIKKALH